MSGPAQQNYTPESTDLSIQMLREVFGNAFASILGNDPSGTANAAANMLGTAFSYFNGGVLFFGAIIMTWVTIFGVTNTANDGAALGKKWSTFYTPLRTFTAAALLIPGSSGYSGIQFLVLLIVSASVGFASTMWGAVVDHIVDDQAVEQALASVQEDPNFDQIAYNALRMQVCARAVTVGINRVMGDGSVNFRRDVRNSESSSIPITTLAASATPITAAWGITEPYKTRTYTTTATMKDVNWAGSESICGKLVLTNTYIAPNSNAQSTTDVAANVKNAINTIQAKYVLGLLDPAGEVGQIAQQVISVAESSDPAVRLDAAQINSRMVSLRAKMTAEIRSEVKNQISSQNAELKRKFKAQGWVMAGSLHRNLSEIKDAIRSVSTVKSEYAPGSGNVSTLLTTGLVSNAVQSVMDKYEALASALVQKTNSATVAKSTSGKPTVPAMQTGFTESDFLSGGNSIKTQITSHFNRLSDSVMQGLVFYLAADSRDPVMQVKSIGDWMVTVAESAMLTKALLASSLDGLVTATQTGANQSVLGTNVSVAGAAIAGVVKVCLRLLEELWAMISSAISFLLYGGYFLGVWIPMVPFYVFGLGVVGWLVQVVEAMAAASLWTMMHMTPEREESFIGSQTQGYVLLLSLFFRPAFMVLGLVASMAVLIPSVQFINVGFITAFRFNQADSVTGLFSVAAYLLVYCAIIFGVFMLAFSLPQTLPDRVLKWINAGIPDLGEQGTAAKIEGAASSQARTAAIAASARFASSRSRKKDNDALRSDLATHDFASQEGNAPEGHTGSAHALSSLHIGPGKSE